MSEHTIILAQFTNTPNSKCYTDHESIQSAMEAIVQLFEASIRKSRPENTTYEINELFQYIDNLPDIVVLVYNPATVSYFPHGKKWIQSTILNMFTKK